MEFEPTAYEVYVRMDEQSRITAVNSSAFLTDAEGWTLIDEGSEWPKFMHAQGNYLPKPVYTMDGIPRYKLVDGAAVERTSAEIEEERSNTNVHSKIEAMKMLLEATDYQAIKYAEGWISEADYAPIKAQRQAVRDVINELEAELASENTI